MSKHTPNTQLQYHILFEDLAAALIGPFDNLQQVADHIKFCEDRGDGAVVLAIVPTTVGHKPPHGPYQPSLMERLYADHNAMVRTPQQDRDMVIPTLEEIEDPEWPAKQAAKHQ